MRYAALFKSGELLRRIYDAYHRLASCDLCPHNCGVNRIKGESGVCGAALLPKIASANIHNGEEPPISGTNGSGTIFLTGCSLKCVFCQNFPISQFGNGEEITTKELAARMLKLQKRKAHNINFVTPTHFLPQILAALWIAIPQGFSLPIVWNSSGYEKVDALKLLDGVVSVYLPDMKYCDDSEAVKISSAPGYREINRAAVHEMKDQVGNLLMDLNGMAVSGLIIRHLVLPNQLAGTHETLGWIAENLGTETYISLMRQYFPANKAVSSAVLNRKINDDEYDQAADWLEDVGLENGWVQD
ncbi:MAG: 4Fe-4S cluster-binding domain-containing protein [Desulfuromonadaceae bacterium]|nr:4Fe-4S cluster-binding domain-containing protein [Desulfuromonadaceae bacterium]MDD2855121.1 4Fe-4S cluster-binding domain-containing protein [Desulfuromonadaceae bacterium]